MELLDISGGDEDFRSVFDETKRDHKSDSCTTA